MTTLAKISTPRLPRSSACSVSLALLLIVPANISAFSQQNEERTLEEIKTEAVHRAENGMYPLIGLYPGDVREAFASIHTKDKDEWAAAFMGVADRYNQRGKVSRKHRSRESECRLHPRLATLFFRSVANPCFSRQTAFVRKSDRSISGTCKVLGSATRDRAHPI